MSTYLRRVIYSVAVLLVGAVAGLFSPDAAAFVGDVGSPIVQEFTKKFSTPEVVAVTDEAAVKITLADGIGSGVSIGDGLIITARHVVGDAKQVDIKSKSGLEAKADVLWVNPDYDIALLKTGAKLPSASIDCRLASVGDAIEAIGNPVGMEFVSSYGRIAASPRAMAPAWKSVFVTDLTVIMGNSGGPVFSAGGEIVGIAVGVMSLPSGTAKSYIGFSFVVPSSDVCALLGRS